MDLLKKICSCIIVVVLTLLMLRPLYVIMERKSSKEKYHDFFQEEKDFDVLFFGNSHSMYGFLPLELWNEYGITSYNLGTPSNLIPTSYWVMMNALEYTNPKVVVIDCYLIQDELKVSGDNYSSIHQALDAFPISVKKVEGSLDLLNDSVAEERIEQGKLAVAEERTPIGLIWNYSVYHSRWNEIAEGDFNIRPNALKGATTEITMFPQKVDADLSIMNIDGAGKEYLQRIIEYCDRKNIKVLLTFLPARNGFGSVANWVEQFSNQYGVDYINFLKTHCIDYDLDFYDKRGHLNLSGARKVTSYIGQHLMKEDLGLKNKSHDKEYDDWNNDFLEYEKKRKKQLLEQEEIETYLLLLNSSQFETTILCTKEFENSYSGLIKNISTLGKCEVDICSKMEHSELVKNTPDAKIIVRSHENTIDSVECYNGAIYR